MSKHITELNIDSYRGIRDLNIKNLGDINIIVGDNNCGKTSLLEALQILSSPSDFDNIIFVARQRERYGMPMISRAMFGSFLDIFSKLSDTLVIEMSCQYKGSNLKMKLTGEIQNTLLNNEDMKNINNLQKQELHIDEEIETFLGKLAYKPITQSTQQSMLLNDIDENGIKIRFNKYSKVSRPKQKYSTTIPMAFLSTVDHLLLNSTRSITKNKTLTKDVVEILRNSFDKNIIDYRIIEEGQRYYPVIDHKELGYMSLSSYGDGIKRVIAMAAVASQINNGVLLIDEFETFIHTSAMENVFKMLIDISKKRKLQLFITTHNIEAVEKFLTTNSDEQKNIRVITLYKKENGTVARVLDGVKALKAKNELGLELR